MEDEWFILYNDLQDCYIFGQGPLTPEEEDMIFAGPMSYISAVHAYNEIYDFDKRDDEE